MARKTVEVETTGQAYLELLRERGVEYFFANAGTDFAPLIDAFARFAEQGKQTPKPITVPHENAAVAMAHGYYMVTGKPQMVMVHVNVGTGNAINGIINAARDNVPILFTAGRTPLTEAGLPGARNIYIHWAQESFDQAGMLREYVKWDYELRNFTQLEAVVDRALEIAMTEPRGPIYMTLPREVLAEPQTEFTMSSPARRDLGGRLYPDPQSIETAAAMLAGADNPLIITGTSGRNPETVGHLVALAESFAIPVVEFNRRYLCFPTNHPLHLGYAPEPFIEAADVVLAIDSDVPWFPALKNPPADGKVIHLGLDPIYSTYPIRSFPCDLAIRADSSAAIPLLTEALAAHRKGQQRSITARAKRLQAVHEQQRAAWRQAVENVRHDSPLDPVWVSHCINEIKDEDTIIVNEYDLVPTQADFTTPGTIFGNSPAGGLGWGLGAALGAKLAAPQKLVIATLGDGSYMFGNPTPCHFVSQAQGLPTLTVIFNNRVWNAVRRAKLAAPQKLVIATLGDGSYMFGNPTPCHFVSQAQGLPTLTVIFNNRVWNAVRRANLGMYPNGWAAKTNNFPLSELQPSPHFEMVVAASGGYGERVESASEMQPALQRALKAVQVEGRQAVLNVICKHP